MSNIIITTTFNNLIYGDFQFIYFNLINNKFSVFYVSLNCVITVTLSIYIFF